MPIKGIIFIFIIVLVICWCFRNDICAFISGSKKNNENESEEKDGQ